MDINACNYTELRILDRAVDQKPNFSSDMSNKTRLLIIDNNSNLQVTRDYLIRCK